MQCIFAVCASWGYWHIEHVTNNGISSLSPATTGSNGHVFWFLQILNTSGPIPSQHWAPKLDCRPLWRFVYLPSLSSPSTKKEPVNRSLLPPPQKWLSKPASRMENYRHFCLPAQYDPAGPSLKIKPFLTSRSRVWSWYYSYGWKTPVCLFTFLHSVTWTDFSSDKSPSEHRNLNL